MSNSCFKPTFIEKFNFSRLILLTKSMYVCVYCIFSEVKRSFAIPVIFLNVNLPDGRNNKNSIGNTFFCYIRGGTQLQFQLFYDFFVGSSKQDSIKATSSSLGFLGFFPPRCPAQATHSLQYFSQTLLTVEECILKIS